MDLSQWMAEHPWSWVVFSLLMVLMAPFMWSAVEILRRGEEFIRIIWRNYAVLGVATVAYFLVGQRVMYDGPILGFGSNDAGLDSLGPYYTWEFAVIDFLSQVGILGTCVVMASSAVWASFGLVSTLSFSALVAALVYPVLGHGIWAEEGWLTAMGFRDMGGGILCFGLAAGLVLGVALGRVGSQKCAPSRKELDRPTWLLALAAVAVVVWCLPWWGGFGASLGFVSVVIFCTVALPMAAALVTEFLCGREIRLRTAIHGALAGMAMAASGATMIFGEFLWMSLSAILSAVLFVIAREAFRSWSFEDPVDIVATFLPASILGSFLVGFETEAAGAYYEGDIFPDLAEAPASAVTQLLGSGVGIGLGIVAGWVFSFFLGRAIHQWRAATNKAPKEEPAAP